MSNSITITERSIPIANIVRAPSLMMRVKLDDATVKKYATAMADGAVFPPVEIMQVDSRFLLTGGFHRTAAAELNGSTAIWASVRSGTMEGAILAAARADAHGGLKRSNDDKRRTVEALLEIEWGQTHSDHMVAEASGVSQTFVSSLRRGSTENETQLKPKRQGKDGRVRSAKPNKTKPEPIKPESAEPPKPPSAKSSKKSTAAAIEREQLANAERGIDLTPSPELAPPPPESPCDEYLLAPLIARLNGGTLQELLADALARGVNNTDLLRLGQAFTRFANTGKVRADA